MLLEADFALEEREIPDWLSHGRRVSGEDLLGWVRTMLLSGNRVQMRGQGQLSFLPLVPAGPCDPVYG